MDEPRIDSLQGAARLTDWGVIRAQGSDAGSFLHGQLTQDEYKAYLAANGKGSAKTSSGG